MAKLIFTENGKQIIRTFTHIWLIRPDGRMSEARRVDDGYTLCLTTGEDAGQGRPLTILMPEVPGVADESRIGSYALAFVLGAIVMVLYTARFATF